MKVGSRARVLLQHICTDRKAAARHVGIFQRKFSIALHLGCIKCLRSSGLSPWIGPSQKLWVAYGRAIYVSGVMGLWSKIMSVARSR